MPKTSDHQQLIPPDGILARCGFFWGEKRHAFSREQIYEERLLISKDTMSKLLAGAEKECEVPLFHNDVITAFLLEEIHHPMERRQRQTYHVCKLSL